MKSATILLLFFLLSGFGTISAKAIIELTDDLLFSEDEDSDELNIWISSCPTGNCDDSYKLDYTESYSVTGGNSVLAGQNIFQYDQTDLPIESINQKWISASNQWLNDKRFTYTYDITGNLIQRVRTDWDATSNSWINKYLYDNTIDSNCNRVESIRYSWNPVTANWDLSLRYIYTYDSNDLLVERTKQTWNGSNWVNNTQYIYENNANGQRTLNTIYKWSIQWDLDSKYEYNYNTLGQLSIRTKSLWTLQWELDNKTEYAYDISGNEINRLKYLRVGASWDAVSSQSSFWSIYNYAPTSTELSDNTFVSTDPVGTTVAVFNTIDPDDNNFTYTLIPGDGSNDIDNVLFSISGNTLQTNSDFSGNATLFYYVFVQIEDGSGAVCSQPFTLEMLIPPTVVINEAGPFCENDITQTLTASPAGGVWSGAANTLGQINPATLGSGTFTASYAYTADNGLSAESSVDIIINPSPVISIETLNTYCENDTIQFLSATPAGGSWSGAADALGSFDPAVLGAGIFTVNYTFTDQNMCSATQSDNIQINASPDISITPAGPFFVNDGIQILTANPPGGFWGGAATAEGQINPANLGVGVFTATYFFADINGCDNSDETFIIINETNAPSITPSDPFCANEPIQTLSATPAGGVWSGASSPEGQIDPEALGAGNHVVFYTYTNINGTSTTAQSVVIVNPLPEVLIMSDGFFCEGDPLQTLIASPAGGVWSGEIINPLGQIDPSVTTPGTYMVSFQFTDENNCSNEDQIEVSINTYPEVNIAPIDGFCYNNESVQISGIPSGGTWAGQVDSLGFIYPGQLQPGTHLAVYTFSTEAGCSSTVFESFEIYPQAEISYTSPLEICDDNSSYVLQVMPSGGIWDNIVDSNGVIDLEILEPDTYPIAYTYIDENQCINTLDTFIYVNAIPEIIIEDTSPACYGDPAFALSASPSGGIWTGITDDSGIINPGAISPGSYSLFYEFSDTNGCLGAGETNIIINELPTVAIVPNGPFSVNDPVQNLFAIPANGIWGGTSDEFGAFDPSAFGVGFHEVTYEYTDENGCTASDTLIIEVKLAVSNNNLSLTALKVYPNPVSEILYISIPEFETNNIRLELINPIGQTQKVYIFDDSQNIKEINISSIQKGIYLLKFYANNHSLTKRIIIE